MLFLVFALVASFMVPVTKADELDHVMDLIDLTKRGTSLDTMVPIFMNAMKSQANNKNKMPFLEPNLLKGVVKPLIKSMLGDERYKQIEGFIDPGIDIGLALFQLISELIPKGMNESTTTEPRAARDLLELFHTTVPENHNAK